MPSSKAASRRLVLRRLLDGPAVSTQEELVRRLSEAGHTVTQATVSRDLAAIGVLKSEGPSGEVVYKLREGDTIPLDARSAALRKHFQDFVIGIDSSLNLTVVRTHPGSAPTVASALDAAHLDGVVGTVAGDDTVIVVNRAPDGGETFARTLGEILKG